MTSHHLLRSALLGLFLISAAGRAQSTVVWQIGTFDESSHEFHSGAAATVDPVFTVGQSNPAQDWYSDQPGTANGMAGFRAHPFTVKFELPQAPQGLYSLKLAVLHYSPLLSVLEVNLNGHRGRFFQHPILNYAAGNSAGHFQPEYSLATITFDVPTRYLQQGMNTLVLIAVDEPGTRNDSRGAVGAFGASQITYDALALVHDPARTFSAEAVSAEIQPTIFYKSKGNSLVELVDVFVRYNEPPKQGRVTLELGSNQLTRELAAGTDFGEQKITFEAPEFSSPVTVRATVALNGRSRQISARVTPGKKWNAFIVPHQHMDIGYTDYVPKVAEVQARAIDEAIDMIHENPDFRYTLDSYWPAEQFMAGRSEAQRKEFLRLVREKKILVPAQYAGNYTGLPSLEYLLRSFYHSYKFNRENGGDFDDAFITDIPSHSWSYPSTMAAAGLKYLLLPANNDLGPMLLIGHLHEKTPFWWEGPDGERILVWYSRHYHQVASMFGLPPKVEGVHDNLPLFMQIYTRPDYKSDGVMVFGTQWENTDLYHEQSTFVGDWNREYAYPKLRYSGIAEAMGYIAKQMGDSIPVIKGDGGPYWDVFAAGRAYYTALARENESRVLAAEKFSTISSIVNPRIWPDREAMDALWKGLLAYQEHTNGGGRNRTISMRHSKAPMDLENQRLLETVLMRGMSALADAIQNPSGTIIVFNPLNWQRSKLVEFDLARNRELVDLATKQVVPVEELPAPAGAGLAAGRGAGSRRVRFLATDIPAVGYRCYAMRQSKTEAPAPTSAGNTLENAYYRVTLDPVTGAISSVFDKELNREFVDSSGPYRFNQFVDATGTQDSRNRSALSTKIVPPPNFQIQVSGSGRLVSVTRTAFGTVARLEASAPNNPRIASEIILFDGQKKIEITNRIQKELAPTGEWGYFAFPFAMDRPEFRFDIQNGVVNPAKDVLPGGAREWSVVQHWAAVDQGDVTAAIVPLDAPLVAFGDIIRWRWPSEFGTRKATIFSYAFQGAGAGQELTFRYVFTSGRRLTPGALSKLGWEAMSPFELNEIVGDDKVDNPKRPLDAAQGSFVQVDHPNVVLVTWKEAEDVKGTIMRFVETNGQAATVKVTSPILNVERAWLCNSVEETQRPLTVSPGGFSFDVKPFEIVTVRLEGTSRVKAAE
ncbi:MAG: polysaccharide lyase family protein [Acidobacteria bacterium]|nr:polysaccharide lyase family protein [Acidobacteriota bacterium]